MTDTLYMRWTTAYSRCTFKVSPFKVKFTFYLCSTVRIRHASWWVWLCVCLQHIPVPLLQEHEVNRNPLRLIGAWDVVRVHVAQGGREHVEIDCFLFDYFSGFPETLNVFCDLETYSLSRGSPTAQHLQLCQCTLFIARCPDMHFCQPASAEM